MKEESLCLLLKGLGYLIGSGCIVMKGKNISLHSFVMKLLMGLSRPVVGYMTTVRV
jgi:hypothetical protein